MSDPLQKPLMPLAIPRRALLAGVMFQPGLNQGDGIHPNAQGVKIVVAKLAPAVAAALKSRS